MRLIIFLLILIINFKDFAQGVSEKLKVAVEELKADSQMKHAIISFYVVEKNSGRAVYNINEEVGLAGASVQKVITATTAIALLGNEFRYTTRLFYHGSLSNNILNGDIIIRPSGDPTLGSWRYKETKEDIVIRNFTDAIKKAGIKGITGKIIVEGNASSESIPDGWIWEDIGSYYGAGASPFIWRENQYDLIMRSGNNLGDTVELVGTKPEHIPGLNIKMLVTAGKAGTGDRSYIFIPSTDSFFSVRGTIPVNESSFSVSGAMLHPDKLFIKQLSSSLGESFFVQKETVVPVGPFHLIFEHRSPPLDSIIFWFLKKSINLYGEALIRSVAQYKTGHARTDSGVQVIKEFWSSKGIDPLSLNIKDGSGLSPGNRITTTSLVNILQYNLKQPWFNSFYYALPEINKMKMKSGTIADVLSYTGFAGPENNYLFSLIINNYNGSTEKMRQKMWKLLDNLK